MTSIATKIDLTEAVDAMARDTYTRSAKAVGMPDDQAKDSFDYLPPAQQNKVRQTMLEILMPAVPFIAASAVREALQEASMKTSSASSKSDFLEKILDVAEEFSNA